MINIFLHLIPSSFESMVGMNFDSYSMYKCFAIKMLILIQNNKKIRFRKLVNREHAEG